MESINPNDIDDIDHNLISLITLKNGNVISIDDSIPAKKNKNASNRNLKYRNYQISQKLINLTIVSKKENLKGICTNFNSKNKICKNNNFYYNPKESNKKENLNVDNKKESNKNVNFFDNLGSNKKKKMNLRQ